MTSDLTTLRWFIDDVDLLIYAYSTGDESRLPFTLSITLPISPGLEIAVTSVAPSTVNRDLFDATSTLTTNITLLQAFNMQDFTCGTFETRSETVTVNFNILGEQIMHISVAFVHEFTYHISLNNGRGVYYLYSLPAPGVKLRQAFI